MYLDPNFFTLFHMREAPRRELHDLSKNRLLAEIASIWPIRSDILAFEYVVLNELRIEIEALAEILDIDQLGDGLESSSVEYGDHVHVQPPADVHEVCRISTSGECQGWLGIVLEEFHQVVRYRFHSSTLTCIATSLILDIACDTRLTAD